MSDLGAKPCGKDGRPRDEICDGAGLMDETRLCNLIDDWVAAEIEAGNQTPDFWDELNTSERLAAFLIPRLDDLMRDAARYRWLKNCYRAWDAGTFNSPTPHTDKPVEESEFDGLIDAEIARAHGDG